VIVGVMSRTWPGCRLPHPSGYFEHVSPPTRRSSTACAAGYGGFTLVEDIGWGTDELGTAGRDRRGLDATARPTAP
jgi:hypothetical protein